MEVKYNEHRGYNSEYHSYNNMNSINIDMDNITLAEVIIIFNNIRELLPIVHTKSSYIDDLQRNYNHLIDIMEHFCAKGKLNEPNYKERIPKVREQIRKLMVKTKTYQKVLWDQNIWLNQASNAINEGIKNADKAPKG